jgi:septum site-determining protein MinC
MASSREADGSPLELKGRMATVTILRLKSADPECLLRHLDRRLAEAPAMFRGMPVALDLDALDPIPGDDALGSVVAGLRERGLAPVAITGGHAEKAPDLASRLGLGVIRSGATTASEAPPKPAPAAAPVPTRIVTQPVRSGQQVYARGGDLILLTSVSPGAEVLADGCIHVYGALNGRALAGVQGDRTARIFCRQFNAELVAIAGHYQISENIEEQDRGRDVQISLQGDALSIEPLAPGS